MGLLVLGRESGFLPLRGNIQRLGAARARKGVQGQGGISYGAFCDLDLRFVN